MLQAFTDWLAAPYNDGMSAQRWFAFVGLLLAALIVWGYVLREIKEVA